MQLAYQYTADDFFSLNFISFYVFSFTGAFFFSLWSFFLSIINSKLIRIHCKAIEIVIHLHCHAEIGPVHLGYQERETLD